MVPPAHRVQRVLIWEEGFPGHGLGLLLSLCVLVHPSLSLAPLYKMSAMVMASVTQGRARGRSLQQRPDLFGSGVVVEVPRGVPGQRGHSHPTTPPARSAAAPLHPRPHLRAFRSPSVLVEGWSFKILMQPFIWRGERERL